ncbi:MAG: hypothetical protein OEZ06_11375 [Myxococcales bacterium]|nr:hypothetical protein [Myxococcales bacterium]
MGAAEQPKGVGLAIWALVFVGLLLSAGRHPVVGDAGQICLIATQLEHGALGTPRRERRDLTQGPDGSWYSKYALGGVLQCSAAQLLRRMGPSGPEAPVGRLLMAAPPAAVAAAVGQRNRGDWGLSGSRQPGIRCRYG